MPGGDSSSDNIAATLGKQRSDRASRRLIPLVWVAALVISGVLIGHALLTPASGPQPAASVAVGTPLPPAGAVNHRAPNVSLVTLDGRPVSIADFRGQVVILNFWYVACAPCHYEMPIIERVYHADQSRGVTVIGVDAVDDAGSITQFARGLGIDYTLLRDTSQQAWSSYQITVTPTTFVIDRNGVIRAKLVGAITESQRLIDALAPSLSAR